MVNKAVVFLCKKPHANTIKFAAEVYQDLKIDVLIISDEYPEIMMSELPKGVVVQYIPDEVCISNSYINSNINSTSTHINKDPIAWDKFIYLFCEVYTKYDFVWVFEDDCFIPSTKAIKNLDNKYSIYDLVCANNFYNDGSAMDWHWRSIYPKLDGPYYYSMVCACGISRALFNEIKLYKNDRKSLCYIEVMFNTIAMNNNLIVCEPFELKSIVWLGEWGLNEFILLEDNIFHPKKDITNYYKLRDEIAKAKNENYQPLNNLPEFIKELM